MRWEPFNRSKKFYDFIVSSFVKRSSGTLKRGGGGLRGWLHFILFWQNDLLFFYIRDNELISELELKTLNSVGNVLLFTMIITEDRKMKYDTFINMHVDKARRYQMKSNNADMRPGIILLLMRCQNLYISWNLTQLDKAEFELFDLLYKSGRTWGHF